MLRIFCPITFLLAIIIFGSLITSSASGLTSYEIDISKGAGYWAYGKCVIIKNCFYPNPLIIAKGTAVIWRNTDKVGHFVVSGKPNDNDAGNIFDSHGVIRSGNTFQFTFVNSGTYDYHCSAHPWMTGQVSVVENMLPKYLSSKGMNFNDSSGSPVGGFNDNGMHTKHPPFVKKITKSISPSPTPHK